MVSGGKILNEQLEVKSPKGVSLVWTEMKSYKLSYEHHDLNRWIQWIYNLTSGFSVDLWTHNQKVRETDFRTSHWKAHSSADEAGFNPKKKLTFIT